MGVDTCLTLVIVRGRFKTSIPHNARLFEVKMSYNMRLFKGRVTQKLVNVSLQDQKNVYF